MIELIIKRLIKKIIFGNKADPETYLEYLRSIGMAIGLGTTIFASPRDCVIDEQNPHLITIGENVQITRGVVILSHDYGWSVIKGKYGDVVGHQEPISIGDNVFIGMNSIILAGSNVGSNVIIGAGSIVTGNIPSNTVVAGVPARVICTLDDYREKRLSKMTEEARAVYSAYLKRYGREPGVRVFREYFWLFSGSDSELPACLNEVNELVNPAITNDAFRKWNPPFTNFDEFISFCRNQEEVS